MKLKLEIQMDNDAFGGGSFDRGTELNCILSGLAKKIQDQGASTGNDWNLFDTNGNKVGQAKISK